MKRPPSPLRPSARLTHWLGWLGTLPVAALALFLMRPVLSGGAPTSSDHMAHLFQSWDLWTHRLAGLRVGGWSDWWFFGYPAGELYHPGTDLWVAAWRIATLGLLEWADGYALAFVVFFVFSGLALYRYGARELGWIAGMLGAALWLLDRGEYEQGGWLYTVRAGVWPQALGLAFFFAGLTWLERALTSARPRHMAAAAVLLGCGVLAHPMDLVLMGLCLPLPWLARAMTRRSVGPHALLVPGAVAVLAAGLAAFWWLPLAVRTSWTEAVGYPWLPAAELLSGLWNGTLFPGTPGWVIPLGALGGVLAVVRRRPGGVLLLLLFAVLMALASSEISMGLAELTGSEALGRFQYRRFTIPAKACLFLLAGYPVQCLLDGAWALAGSPRLATNRQAWVRGGLALATTALAAGLLSWQAPALHTHLETLDLPTANSAGQWQDYQALNASIRATKAERPGFWRIAYEGREHDQFFWSAPVYNGVPGYKPGFTCCRIFRQIPQGQDDALYRTLSVGMVVSKGPADRPGLTLMEQHGELFAYSFDDFQAERWTLEGPGTVLSKRFEREHIELQLEGTGPTSRLRLHVAGFSRWNATMDGQPVDIGAATPSPGQPPILMEFPVSDGALTLRYRRQLIDWLGMLASTLTLVALGWLAIRRRRLWDATGDA